VDGLVEPEEVAQGLALGFGDVALGAEHLVDDVAWDEAEQEEDEDGDAEDGRYDGERSSHDVGLHGGRDYILYTTLASTVFLKIGREVRPVRPTHAAGQRLADVARRASRAPGQCRRAIGGGSPRAEFGVVRQLRGASQPGGCCRRLTGGFRQWRTLGPSVFVQGVARARRRDCCRLSASKLTG